MTVGPEEERVATVAMQERADGAVWKQRLAPYQTADDRLAWAQLLSTVGLFVLTWTVMYVSLEVVGWWLTLVLAPIAALLLVRLFIVQHDCGHGSFFRSKALNERVGACLGVLTLTPYHYWKRTHAVHHATAGDLDRRSMGDVTTLTVAEYVALPWWRRVAYRLYRHPLVMLGVGPVYVFVLKHRLPLDIPWSWRREWRSVLATDAALVAVVALAWVTVGIESFLLVQLPITLLSGPVGVWLFYVQHQFEDTYWARHDGWSYYEAALRGSSFYDLPQVLHWFTGNIGYHHIHHLSSRIPNYRLPSCFRDIPELQQAPRLGLADSLGCLRLRLWDEEARRLVGFRDLRRTATTS